MDEQSVLEDVGSLGREVDIEFDMEVDMVLDMVLDIKPEPGGHAVVRAVCGVIDFVLNELTDWAMTGVTDFV